MRKLFTLTAAAAFAVAATITMGAGLGTAVAGGPKGFSDFALFDGTNPDNLGPGGQTGVICGVADDGVLQLEKSFTLYVAVTAFTGDPTEVRVVFTDRDLVRYKLPTNGSFSFSQAAGSNEFDVAVRVVADANVAGWVSAQGKSGTFCISCDEEGDTDAFCDLIIPTPTP